MIVTCVKCGRELEDKLTTRGFREHRYCPDCMERMSKRGEWTKDMALADLDKTMHLYGCRGRTVKRHCEDCLAVVYQ